MKICQNGNFWFAPSVLQLAVIKTRDPGTGITKADKGRTRIIGLIIIVTITTATVTTVIIEDQIKPLGLMTNPCASSVGSNTWFVIVSTNKNILIVERS